MDNLNEIKQLVYEDVIKLIANVWNRILLFYYDAKVVKYLVNN